MPRLPSPTARRLVWTGASLLTVLHQDFWLWDNRQLCLGFLPAGLAYHILHSLLTAAFWIAAIRWAWPAAWERWAETGGQPPSARQEDPSQP